MLWERFAYLGLCARCLNIVLPYASIYLYMTELSPMAIFPRMGRQRCEAYVTHGCCQASTTLLKLLKVSEHVSERLELVCDRRQPARKETQGAGMASHSDVLLPKKQKTARQIACACKPLASTTKAQAVTSTACLLGRLSDSQSQR